MGKKVSKYSFKLTKGSLIDSSNIYPVEMLIDETNFLTAHNKFIFLIF